MVGLADRVDAGCGGRRVTSLDIGGGLAVNVHGPQVTPSFADYAQTLERVLGGDVLRALGARRVFTEFGKALVAKTAAVAARVEEVLLKPHDPPLLTAICHAGADLFLRTAYCPKLFPLRVALLDGLSLTEKRPQSPATGLITYNNLLLHLSFIIIRNVVVIKVYRQSSVRS